MAIAPAIDVPEGEKPIDLVAYGTAAEVATIYTGISGMLAVLIIMDVLVRAEARLKPKPAPEMQKAGGQA
jgi:hypothetical protein